MDGIIESFGSGGYGFLRPLVGRPNEVANVYFHVSACQDGIVPPLGARVSFLLVRGNQGPQAANIRLLTLGGEALQRPTATGRYKFVPAIPDGPPDAGEL